MKRFSSLLLTVFLLLCALSASGQPMGNSRLTWQSERWAGNYASLNALVAAHNAQTPSVLPEKAIIDSTLTLSGADVVIPATLTLAKRGAGMINCNGRTVIILGPVEAEGQLFTNCSRGQVRFSSDVLVDADGSTTIGVGTPDAIAAGTTLRSYVFANETIKLCTDLTTDPLNVRIDGDGNCSTATGGEGSTALLGAVTTGSNQVPTTWGYVDDGATPGAYDDGEDLYIDLVPAGTYQLGNTFVKEVPITWFGAVGDGATDNSATMQVAATALANGQTLFTPPGTYLIKTLLGVVFNRKHGIKITGAPGALWQRSAAAGVSDRLATCNDCQDVEITSLNFDANGITSFSGFVFYRAKRIWIHHTKYVDSNRQTVATTDRYSWLFANDIQQQHEDVWLTDNYVENLELVEIDNFKRAHILHNTNIRPVYAGGIVMTSVVSGTTNEEAEIADNFIYEPYRCGAILAHEGSAGDNNTYRHLSFSRNIIINQTVNPAAASISLAASAGTGNTYTDVQIVENQIYWDPALATPRSGIVVGATNATTPYTQLVIARNTVYTENDAIDINACTGCKIDNNYTYGGVRGIILRGNATDTQMTNNTAESVGSIAFQVQNPLGGVRAQNNYIIGTAPTTTYSVTALTATDIVRRNLVGAYALNLAAPGASPGCVDSAAQTLTGAALGEPCFASMSVNMQTGQQLGCFVNAANQVTFRVCDYDGTATDPDGAGATYTAWVN